MYKYSFSESEYLAIIELIISIFFLIPWWISSIENFSAKISIALFDSPDTMAIL